MSLCLKTVNGFAADCSQLDPRYEIEKSVKVLIDNSLNSKTQHPNNGKWDHQDPTAKQPNNDVTRRLGVFKEVGQVKRFKYVNQIVRRRCEQSKVGRT